MALLYRFLGWLSTLIPGVSIPIGQLRYTSAITFIL